MDSLRYGVSLLHVFSINSLVLAEFASRQRILCCFFLLYACPQLALENQNEFQFKASSKSMIDLDGLA